MQIDPMILNVAFTSVKAFIGVALCWAVVWSVPKKAWQFIEGESRAEVEGVVKGVLKWSSIPVLVFAVVTSLNTHGPRVKLDTVRSDVYTPVTVEVERGESWTNHEDRFGKFDERIETEEVE